MEIFVRNYSDSKDCKKELIDPITYKITDNKDAEFIVKFSIEFDHWECSCPHLVLIGLPCAHLIAVINDPNIQGAFEYYINPRWIHYKQDRISEHARPFITNKKRRP